MQRLSSPLVLTLAAGLALPMGAQAQQSQMAQQVAPAPPVRAGGPISNVEQGLPPALDAVKPAPHDGPVVQVALLLDTSNSMDGLIDQARSELWTVINTLRGLRHETGDVQFQVALYQYGNDALEESDGYVQLRAPFTTDLDVVSQQLFALTTNGGSEYCGWVIGDASRELAWAPVDDEGAPTLRLIVVAGNEPFTQGSVSYSESIPDARAKDVRVHTVFCGGNDEGISTSWGDGAALGDGFYFSIDQNSAVRFNTPFDGEIITLNGRLNATYHNFSRAGRVNQSLQLQMDAGNAAQSEAQMVERAAAKASHFYSNSHWDIVDRYRAGELVEDDIEPEALPEEWRGLTFEELTVELDGVIEERTRVQQEIAELYKKREAEVATQRAELGVRTLGVALAEAIIGQAREQGFTHVNDIEDEPRLEPVPVNPEPDLPDPPIESSEQP